MKNQTITDKTTVKAAGFCYNYRNHHVTILPGFCQLLGEIRFENRIVRSGSCGYGLKSAIEKINSIIDDDITNNP